MRSTEPQPRAGRRARPSNERGLSPGWDSAAPWRRATPGAGRPGPSSAPPTGSGFVRGMSEWSPRRRRDRCRAASRPRRSRHWRYRPRREPTRCSGAGPARLGIRAVRALVPFTPRCATARADCSASAPPCLMRSRSAGMAASILSLPAALMTSNRSSTSASSSRMVRALATSPSLPATSPRTMTAARRSSAGWPGSRRRRICLAAICMNKLNHRTAAEKTTKPTNLARFCVRLWSQAGGVPPGGPATRRSLPDPWGGRRLV